MVRVENLESKLTALRKYLQKLDRYRSMDFETIKTNQDLLGATERYLFLAIQSAIDAAEVTCRLKKLGHPSSMSESFRLLGEAKILNPNQVESSLRMIGFRNALSHGYENFDYSILEAVLKVNVQELVVIAERLENVF